MGGCPPVPGFHHDRRALCTGFAEEARDLAISARVSRVAIGADWEAYFSDPTLYLLDESGARVAPGASSDAVSPQDTLRGTVEIIGDVIEPVVPVGAWHATHGILLSQERRRPHPRAKRSR